jgi:GntR family transcriptional regulator
VSEGWALVDRSSFKPLYHQLADHLLEGIQSGDWLIGDTLPSEQDLMNRFGVSRNTVRGGLRRLEQDGFIYRVAGKGTFVASTRLDQSLGRLTGFSEDARALGMKPRYRNLAIQVQPASPYVAAKLHLAPESEIIFVHRLQLANDLPYVVVKAFLPRRWFDLRGFDVMRDLQDGSFYALLENRYGIRMGKSTITITADAATGETARLLRCSEGAPVLISRRVTLTEDEEAPIEYTIGEGHPQRHQWSTTLVRHYT